MDRTHDSWAMSINQPALPPEELQKWDLYCVTRHPHDRLISKWLNKLTKGMVWEHDPFLRPHRSFADFVNALECWPWNIDMQHFGPQSADHGWYLMRQLQNVRILDVSELSFLEQALSMKTGTVIEAPRLNAQQYTEGVSNAWDLDRRDLQSPFPAAKSFYNKDLRDRVSDMFARDMRQFEYTGWKVGESA